MSNDWNIHKSPILKDGNEAPEVLMFSRNHMPGVPLTYKIWEGNDYMYFACDGSMRHTHSFIFPKEYMMFLTNILEDAISWEKKYDEPDTYDGYFWEVKYNYGGLNIDSYGINKWPDNYEYIKKQLQLKMEGLCMKYAEDYSDLRRWARLRKL